MPNLKSLIIFKEIRNPSGKFLRVSAKNELKFEMFEKILKLIRKSSLKNWFFIHFLSDLPGLLSFYSALDYTTIFLQ